MADFCKQCSIDIFQKDFGELAGLSKPENTANGLYATAICEGCGVIQVNHLGECISPDCFVDHKTGNPRDARRDPQQN